MVYGYGKKSKNSLSSNTPDGLHAYSADSEWPLKRFFVERRLITK